MQPTRGRGEPPATRVQKQRRGLPRARKSAAKPPRAPDPAKAEKDRLRRQKKQHKQGQRRQKKAQRDHERQRQRHDRETTKAARAAKRRARRLALALLAQETGRRLRRLVWPPYTRRLPRTKAVLVLALNIAPFPGLGTVIYGKWERGLFQFLLTFLFLIGLAWAVTDGVRIVMHAFEPPGRRQERARRGQPADV